MTATAGSAIVDKHGSRITAVDWSAKQIMVSVANSDDDLLDERVVYLSPMQAYQLSKILADLAQTKGAP